MCWKGNHFKAGLNFFNKPFSVKYKLSFKETSNYLIFYWRVEKLLKGNLFYQEWKKWKLLKENLVMKKEIGMVSKIVKIETL